MNTDDSKNEEDIKKVDPQVDTQNIRESDEFYTTDGEPVYLGILSEEEILIPDQNKIEEAKKKLAELMNFHSAEIKSCQSKTLVEAREVLQKLEMRADVL